MLTKPRSGSDKSSRGFAAGDNARRAAQKNHELGTAHRFTSDTGRKAGKEGLQARWGDRQERRDTLQ